MPAPKRRTRSSKTKPDVAPRTKKSVVAQAEMLTLTRLEQIRVLADPLRLRIVEAFCDGEFTTKQVAEKLNEKPTKLYHHVDALERVGLIRLSRTRQNRGTLEKYYIAVARSFRADATLFSAAAPISAKRAALETMVSTLFERGAREMNDLVSGAASAKDVKEEGVLSFIETRGTKAQMRKLQDRLHRLIQELQREEPGGRAAKSRRRFRFMLAFYPLDRGGETP